jgi:hypothetical protein
MAKRMRADEVQGFLTGVEAPEARERGREALARLSDIAGRSPERADIVIMILENLAEIVEEREVPQALPPSEQRLWEQVGARFDDTEAVARVGARAAAALTDLVERSLAGDGAVAEQLQVDRSRVSQRISEGSLYTFSLRGERYFPDWQFDDGLPALAFKRVINALDPSAHPLLVDHWFRSPNVDLVIEDEPVTPIDWLTTGGTPDMPATLAEDL